MDIPNNINQGNPGGLKFVVMNGAQVLFTCYRATFEGGLDYCNNTSDRLYLNKTIADDTVLEMIVSNRPGMKSRVWNERYRGTRNGYNNSFNG